MVRTFVLSPRWLALHVVAIALVAAFAALGWWQLDAYRTSQDRHDTRAADAVPLSEVIEPGQPVEYAQDRPVIADGFYVASLAVPARVNAGVLGAYAVGALETGDGVLIVLRGWAAAADGIAVAPSGDMSVTGHLLPEESDAEASGRELGPDQIGYLASAPAAAALGRDDIYAGYLVLSSEEPDHTATLERLDIDELAPIRNVGPWQNLSYWAQWWVFAAAVIVFWVSFLRAGIRRARQEPTQVAATQPAPLPRPSAPR